VVEPGSPADEAGLRAGDVISHINGTAVQGLLHVQVVSLILSAGTEVRVQATPLSGTTIKVKVGRRPRLSSVGRATSGVRTVRLGRRHHRPSMSLFRRLSNRRAAEQQAINQLGVHPTTATQSQYIRSLSTGAEGQGQAAGRPGSSDSDSSQASSGDSLNSPLHVRPTSLHGLKNKAKLAAAGGGSSRAMTSSVTSSVSDVIGDVVSSSSVVPRRHAVAARPSRSASPRLLLRRCHDDGLPGRHVDVADGGSQPQPAGRRQLPAGGRHIAPVAVVLTGGGWRRRRSLGSVEELAECRRGESVGLTTSVRVARLTQAWPPS